MDEKNFILISIFLPVIGSFILPLAFGKKTERIRNVTALVFILLSFLSSAMLIPSIIKGTKILINLNFNLGFLGENIAVFRSDGLSVFMAMISSFVGAVIVFYSIGYISHYKNQNEYYLLVVLFIGSMMGIVYSANLIFLYIFWEITAICCWRLIGFFREKEHVNKADKAFLVTVFGALLMLIGFIMIYSQTGTFDLTKIEELKSFKISNLAVILILFGIFSKSATLPLHTWLPDAGVAPSPVTSLLHAAVLVKIGVYVYARLFLVTISLPEIWSHIIPIIAAASALITAGAAVIETDLKRIIAYSTVSQLGFIFLGLSAGIATSVSGALIYILMHSISKGGLFLCAGIVEQNAKTKDITKLGGLFSTMSITAITFLFCAFSIMGIPPFGGFWSKFMVISGAVESGLIWITAVFIFGAVLTIIYLFRVFTMVFFGEIKTEVKKEGSLSMLLSVIFLAMLSLISGILIYYPSHFTQFILKEMGGIIR